MKHQIDKHWYAFLLNNKNGIFYGWIIVVSFLCISTVLYGTVQSFGVFFKSIESTFGITRTATSAVTSTNMVIAGLAAFITGWLLDKYGPKRVVLLMGFVTGLSLILTSFTNSTWQLFATYGVLLALGTGARYVVTTAIISRWFNKRRGLALGIAGMGAGLGAVVIIPLATYLVSSFDWRLGYLVIGLVAWITVVPLSMLLKRDPLEVGLLPDGDRFNQQQNDGSTQDISMIGFPLTRVFVMRDFWFINLIWLFFASGLFLIFTHLVPHITDIGFSLQNAAGVMSTLGVATIIGRVLMGIVADKIGRKLTSIISALLQAGAMVWLIWSQELWMFYVFAIVYGFAYSGFGPSMGALIGDIFGLTRIGTIFGMLEISFGLGAAVGPAIGGIIFDNSGSYVSAFIIGACFLWILPVFISLLRTKTVNISKNGVDPCLYQDDKID